MSFSDTSLTGLTANFTLPSGMNGKISSFDCAEDRRWRDSEGFVDGGYQTGKLTGQALSGRVTGYVNGSTLGIGTAFENVAVTATADSGRTITMNIDITNIQWGARVGEMQVFSASFRSNGPYTVSL